MKPLLSIFRLGYKVQCGSAIPLYFDVICFSEESLALFSLPTR